MRAMTVEREDMQPYSAEAPGADEVEALDGVTLLDFGTNWCGHCQAAAPIVESVVGAHPEVRHVRVEDGKGRALGRHFGVKLWPTLVVLRDGAEVSRVIRPAGAAELHEAIRRAE